MWFKMKKLTKQEVFQQLVNNSSAECEGLGEGTVVRYYLHVTKDGVIVNDYSSADTTFENDIPYWCYTDNLDDFYNIADLFSENYENSEWLPFVELVEELTSDANNWLASFED